MKHPCPDIRLLLTEFAADALGADEADAVAAHVARCDDCRAELVRETELRRVLGGLPVQRGPRIDLPARRADRPGRRWLPLAGGLVAAALVVAALLPDADLDRAPEATPVPVASTAPTPTEVAQARRDARAGLVLAAAILARTERHTVADVFGRQLPQAITGSLAGAAATPQGGQG